jgi:type IV pilus assembly protein PilV
MHRPAAGFTLLEVLITIVVVAFGLLGLAGLQVFALKNNQSATMRVAATALANDIIDRMKGNFSGVIAGGYNRSNLADYTTAVAGCNQAGGCTANELAQNDLKEWQDRLAETLPGGEGIVCLDATPNDAAPTPAAPGCDNNGVTVYVVKIWWLDDRSQANIGAVKKHLYTSFNP